MQGSVSWLALAVGVSSGVCLIETYRGLNLRGAVEGEIGRPGKAAGSWAAGYAKLGT